MSGNRDQRLFDKWMEMPDNDCAFVLDRPLQTIGEQGLGVTVSEDALAFLMNQLMVFIGTRSLRHWERTALMPQHIQVYVKVELG